MGAGTSIQTHQQLFDQTTQTRDVMNILLEYMLREITVREFVSMTNPDECKKYVMFMANHLYQHFYELRVTPLRDRNGVLVFRKIKELVDPQDQKDKEEKQSLCLILAYFYTRIFQIYGALALTVIDDANFMVSSGAISILQPQARGLEPRGYSRYYMQGGANIGNFNFLRSYLNSEKEYEGFRTKYTNLRVPIFFNTRVITDDSAISDSEIQEGTFLIGTGGSKPSKLKVTAGRSSFGATNITMKIGELRYYKKKDKEWEEHTATIPETTLRDKKMEFVPYNYEDTGKTAVYQTKGGDSLAEYFNKLFDRLIPYIQTRTETGQITEYGTSDDEKKTYSEEGTVKELRLGRLVSNLRDQRPLGHCIARALQLLQQIPVSNEFVSNVCNVKFSEMRSTQRTSTGKIVTVRPGLPGVDSSLQDNAGLAMTELLFYDAIAAGSPKLLISDQPIDGRKSSLEQYIEFMRRMATLFGDNPDRNASSLRSSGLSGIKNKRDRELCEDTTTGIRITPGALGQVQTIVQDMFRVQYEHTKACGDIIRMLFDIRRDSHGRTSISLSERIIKLGFPEIERINHAARELLMKYYSTCEARYVQGMAVVVQSKRQGNAQALPQAKPQVLPQVLPQAKPQQQQVKAESDIVQAHQQLLSQHRQQLQRIVQSGSPQVKPLATALLNYVTKLPASPIIPEYTYLMISYLGIPHDTDNTRVIREQLLRFKYTQQEINLWNNQKQMMDSNLTRIFFTNDQNAPFYLFSFLSNNPFTDPQDPEKVWKNVSSYYLYQIATYRGDNTLAAIIKNGKDLTKDQQATVRGWLQNPSTDFRIYQRRAMYRGNLLKFMNPVNDPKNMRAILLCSTINRELVFADKDSYWGIGNKDPSTIAGPFNDGNHLGKILMEIRTQLFTSSRSEIVQFIKGDATKPIGSTSALDSTFWTAPR
jgi:predicted NAD-dependent protein-ADP-ribosyltransferase YbiA (DUF1768 family)